MNTVLITGGAGFIGGHLVNQFLRLTDWNVIVLDRLDSTVSLNKFSEMGLLSYIQDTKDIRLKFIWWDLKSEINEQISKRIGEVDLILHLSSSSHVDRSIEDPIGFIQDNVLGTANLLNWSRKLTRLKRIVYFSTDECLGAANENEYFTESDALKPSNPYSGSKAAAEMIATSFAITYNLPLTITRCMNVIDIYQNKEKFVPLVIKKILNKEIIYIHSAIILLSNYVNSISNVFTSTVPGSRYYLNCKDVFDALFLILNTNSEIVDKTSRDKGIYHIRGYSKINNLELAQYIHNIICEYYKDINIEFKYELVTYHSTRPYHDFLYQLSGDKLKELGWTPNSDMLGSIKGTVIWYLEHQNYLL